MTVIDRFLDFVTYDTQSDEETNMTPSTPGQMVFARHLEEILREMKLEEISLDDNGYLFATLPANTDAPDIPGVGFIAHMATSPDMSGKHVKPRIVKSYSGDDIILNSELDIKLTPADFPELLDYVGQDLIVTDGTTLLGADDKAGIAEIISAIAWLQANPQVKHGKIRIGFNPDEEIGLGAHKFDVERFGCDFAYTMDGGAIGELEYENFNAASATVTVHGFSVHPGSAKDAMINASNVAMEFHMALPAMARPEPTEGYQGFYHLCQMYGDVTEAKLGYILRDHDIGKLQFKKDNLLHIACYLNCKYGPGTVEVEIKDSYRNMLEKIKPHFHLVETARKAITKAGLTPEEIPVRGGTDGAVLSWKGLPCPNLGTGGFNFHGVCECTTVERMDKATEILLNIVELYSK